MTSPDNKNQGLHNAVLGVTCVLVVSFFVWSARSGALEQWGLGAKATYYNLLVQGFRAGQLDLVYDVPPDLAKLPDPYDSIANSSYRWLPHKPLHDISYYQGKLYLYYGVTPALVLFWPYAILTGHYLLHKDAVMIFCAIGFLTGAGLLWAMRRRYFPDVGTGVLVAGAIAVGLATGLPVMMARSDVYEVAISCGYAMMMLALAAIWCALHSPAKKGWWIIAASFAYGLAVASRPSLLFGAVILLAPAVRDWRVPSGAGVRHRIRPLLCATVPIMLIGLGLAFYNWRRFGNPLEFGQRYQLAADRQDTMRHFSLGYFWFNFRVYFFEPARWSFHFPFVREIVQPPMPPEHAEVECPFGILTNVPFVWLALATPLGWRNRTAEAASTLRIFLIAMALLFGIGATTLSLYNYACVRYEVEFLPTLIFLAVVGVFSLERTLATRPIWRNVARCGWVLLLAFSIFFNVFARYELYAQTESYLGKALLQNGHQDEAVAHFQKALEIQPGEIMAHQLLGLTLFQKGQFDEALAHFQSALAGQPNDFYLNNNLGLALLQKGQVEDAIAHFQKAIALRPDLTEAHYNLGLALSQSDRPDAAIVQFREAADLRPDLANVQYSLGMALLRTGQLNEAIRSFRDVLRLTPDDANAHETLGIALGRNGQLNDAIGEFTAALKLKPDFADAQRNLALALEMQTNKTSAPIPPNAP